MLKSAVRTTLVGTARAACMLLVLIAGCKQATLSTSVVYGLVHSDQDATALPKVEVTVGGEVVSSDNKGSFSAPYNGKIGDYVAVTARAAGYAPVSRRVQLTARHGVYVPIAMRKVDAQQNVVLPTGDANVTLSVQRGDASAAFTLLPDALVAPDGHTVQGTVNVALTFWHPNQDLSSAPGVLRAALEDGTAGDDQPRGLRTYGMIDIEVRQNDQLLQVAAGKHLGLTITTSQTQRQGFLSQPSAGPAPTLWTLNPNIGLWEEDKGDSTYDPNAGVMTAVLRHLSSKNADAPLLGSSNVNTGGCVRGKVIDACGNGIPGASVTFNFTSRGNSMLRINPLAANLTATTDDLGEYKLMVWPGDHITYSETVDYLNTSTRQAFSSTTQTSLSGPGTNMPAHLRLVEQDAGTPTQNRIPADVLTCSTFNGTCPNAECQCYNDVNDNTCLAQLARTFWYEDGRNSCWTTPDSWHDGSGNVSVPPNGGPCFVEMAEAIHVTNMADVWQAQYGAPALGTLCQNCWPLLNLVITGDPLGVKCDPQNPNTSRTPVKTCPPTPGAMLGQPCVTDADCCDSNLVCLDKLCVPPSDGQ